MREVYLTTRSLKKQAIFFLIDTQGANVVGCYNSHVSGLGTPNIDRLASEGVRFDRAYTCSPVCGPARSAIFTGLYPHSNGVLGNDMAPHLDLPTLGQRFKKAGIRTGYVGKWHLDGTDYFGDGRCPDGWDPEYWFDGRNYLESLTEEERDLSRRVLNPAEVSRFGITSDFTFAHRIADRAIQFIQTHKNEDFFLVVSIDEPHHPYICPEPFVSAFETFDFPVPNYGDSLSHKPRSQQEWANYVEPALQKGEQGLQINSQILRHPRFFGCNSYSDAQVGRVLDAIRRFVPSAFVTYTSDHGDMLASHRLLGKGPAVYEEITRIPLIMSLPGYAPSDVTTCGPVSHIDLIPTWLEFFGLDVPPLLQGQSLLKQLANPAHQTNDSIFIEFNRFEVDHDGFGAFNPIRAIFDGRHKLALNLLDSDELYDLQTDPLEMHNQIEQGGNSRDRLMERLLDWMGLTRDVLRSPHWQRRSWCNFENLSSWGGPTRPRPFDPDFFPATLLYDTGRPIDRFVYDKK